MRLFYVFIFLVCVLIVSGISLYISGFSFYSAPSLFSERLKRVIEPPPIKLFFAGDIMLSRGVYSKVLKEGGDFRYPFMHVASRIQSADIAFANLESPVSSRGVRVGSIYSFRADPESVQGLQYSDFDVLSLANNHMWDYGRLALVDTLRHLRDVSIAPVGAGANHEEANKPAFFSFASTTFAYLAYTDLYPKTLQAGLDSPGVSEYDEDGIRAQISGLIAHKLADVVIVSLHWGTEYTHESQYRQKILARSFVDAGARMVIGHHPHVVQELERYKDGLIAYSLGNFIFDQTFSTGTMTGLALEVFMRGNNIVSVNELVTRINTDLQPVFMSDDEKNDL